MEEPARVGQPVRRSQPFRTHIPFVEEPIRISFDLDNPVSSHAHEKAASAVIHARAVGLFPKNVFGHSSFLSLSIGEEPWGASSGAFHCP
jgi:hypothetical protein